MLWKRLIRLRILYLLLLLLHFVSYQTIVARWFWDRNYYQILMHMLAYIACAWQCKQLRHWLKFSKRIIKRITSQLSSWNDWSSSRPEELTSRILSCRQARSVFAQTGLYRRSTKSSTKVEEKDLKSQVFLWVRQALHGMDLVKKTLKTIVCSYHLPAPSKSSWFIGKIKVKCLRSISYRIFYHVVLMQELKKSKKSIENPFKNEITKYNLGMFGSKANSGQVISRLKNMKTLSPILLLCRSYFVCSGKEKTIVVV